MRITLITATYNSAATLGDCLDSVNKQVYPEIEHVIMDGGSTDNTLDMLRDPARYTQELLVHSEPDNGIYDALNKGIQRASGSVIGFLHSDDILAAPGILARIAELFFKESVDGIYGDLHYVHQLDTSRIIRNWKSRPFKRSLVDHGWMPAHPTFFLKREVYEKHGAFDLSYRIAADYDFMLRVLKDPGYTFARSNYENEGRRG